MDWLIVALRTISFWFDSIIYPLIGTVYELFESIANTTIFSEYIIDIFASKVYSLLGIFMLFKVSFSIMTYIVNPDEFTDKTKGFSKLVTNVIITLGLLVTTPWIFSQAMEIQKIILQDNIIGKIFSINQNSSVSMMDAGNTMAYETLNAFYHLDIEKYPDCAILIPNSDVSDNKDSAGLEDKCREVFKNSSRYDTYKDVLEYSYWSKNVDLYLNWDLAVQKSSDDGFVMDYFPLISSLAGGFIAWILMLFCFDIATRSIKLGFLRMVAPVPIISRIDPKGKGVFDKWLKTTVSTYLDLFIRLLGIYFAVFIISLIPDMSFADAATGINSETNAFVKVFIILGALLFAKQLPKLITDLTGIKMDGKFIMNPLKKMAEVPLAGHMASRVLGATGSAMAGQGIKSGWKAGGKAVPLLGGDGKQSIAGGFNKFNRFTDDGRKKVEEKKKNELGEKLLNKTLVDKIDENGNVTKEVGKTQQYQIYEGSNASKYAESVRAVDLAKDRRNNLQSYYEQMKMNFEANQNKMTLEEKNDAIEKIDKARVDFVKAESDYDKLKKAHNYIRSQDNRNAEIEDAFNAAKDAYEASMKVSGFESKKFEGFTVSAENPSFDDTTQQNTSSVSSTSQSTSSPQFINVGNEDIAEAEISQEQNESRNAKLREKVQQTKTAMEQKEEQFRKIYLRYMNSQGDASVSEAARAKLAKEYEQVKEEREQAIFEHEKAIDEMNGTINNDDV